jgi:hypothetical protein
MHGSLFHLQEETLMPIVLNVRRAAAAISISLALTSSSLFAQVRADVQSQLKVADSAHMQIVTLRDGSKLVGRITAVGGDTVTFQSAVGTLAVAAANIDRVQELVSSSMKDGEYWFPNPNSTRLFFAPSGRMLSRGEGYVSDYEVFFPGFAVGVSDNVSIGGGMSLFPAGVDEQLYYFTPKIGGEVKKDVNLAVGALILGGLGTESTAGIVYGVGTFGPPDLSITAGLGYGFAGTTVAKNPVAMLGGEWRISQRIGLVTENYLIPNTEYVSPLFSYGVRLMGEKLTVDLALFNASGSRTAIGLPYVDFVFSF